MCKVWWARDLYERLVLSADDRGSFDYGFAGDCLESLLARPNGAASNVVEHPLADWQLYLGKSLASMVPPLLASYLGFRLPGGVYIQLVGVPASSVCAIHDPNHCKALVMVSGRGGVHSNHLRASRNFWRPSSSSRWRC